ncbi:Retrovirus-related Pol polyprotein from transposon TNT 1-94 [Vitis vinifera]|uniref:Retrovirus-related Pol polyprotein from transposon TNT 1-94 n=1 Tax=Vitis vinifera TaxID=29760 RepID=A0A438JCA9_VITVI|nr:Retrovirus-related Pol polyprotein from transposon TNT 1-94 [Vitis vinifera]
MLEIAKTTTTAQSEEIIRPRHSGELQNIQAAYRLNGKNYLKWSQLVRTVLKGKGKISHLMELDHYRVIKTKCPEDAAILKDFIEQDRVYDFLVGLNPEFDQVRIQILGKQEVLCFNEVVALIRGEESKRCLMLNPQNTDSWQWTTYGALIVRRHAIPVSGAGNYMENHQVESRDKRENNQVIMVRPMSQQYNRMKQHRTGSLAYSGKFPFSIGLNVSDITFANSWVIDSGATNHMTHSPNIFSTYFPCSSSRKIAIADGSLTTVAVSNKRSSIPFYLIHSDIWGPSPISNITGAKWSDNAKDYFNQILTPYFQREGIIHESSCVNTPQQNGVAERKNGHLLNSTRSFMFQKNVPKSFWGEAVLTTAHLINRLPSRILGFKSPMDILSTFYPNLHTTNNLVPRIFGCVAFVHVHNQNKGKLDPRALKCVFVGYSSTQKGYKCYHPPSKRYSVSVDVTFHEQESYFTIPYLQGENSVMEDKDRGDFLFLYLPSLPLSKQSRPTDPLIEILPKLPDQPKLVLPKLVLPELVLPNQPEPVPENPKSAPENVRFDKAFSRKKTVVPKSVQVQDFNPNSENEVTISNPSLQSESHVNNDDQDLPIAVRKGIRECTNRPLYPLTHFLSFKKFSPSHKAFLVSLNTISIPTTVSKALTNKIGN